MKMIGLARLGRDAEVRYLPDGKAVANLSLAYVCGRKKDGEQYPPSQWIDGSLWGKQAEALAPYLRKGAVHCFEISDVRIETYDGRNGEGFKLVGRVDSVSLTPGGNREQSNDNAGSQQRERTQRPTQTGQPPRGQTGGGLDDMDDDIPF
jgi:single-strand DNA-binding protein